MNICRLKQLRQDQVGEQAVLLRDRVISLKKAA